MVRIVTEDGNRSSDIQEALCDLSDSLVSMILAECTDRHNVINNIGIKALVKWIYKLGRSR